MEISFKDGVFHLAGRIDEYASFDSLARAAAPLKLNLAKVTAINSIGTRRFLGFALGWAPRKFEFYECPPDFIANLNVIPQMLGTPPDETQVKTFYVPYACESCRNTANVLYATKDLRFDKDKEVILPVERCLKCSEVMDLDVTAGTFFLFLKGDT